MAKDTYKDMTAKERETVKEVGSSSTTPSTDRMIKDVGLRKAESAKTETSALKAGIGTAKSKPQSRRKGK